MWKKHFTTTSFLFKSQLKKQKALQYKKQSLSKNLAPQSKAVKSNCDKLMRDIDILYKKQIEKKKKRETRIWKKNM